jgi:HK97 family phage portal protein
MDLKIFKNLFHARDKLADGRRPKNQIGGSYNFLFGGTTSGKNVTEITAMQTSAVYACTKVISEAAACLPIHIYRRLENGDKIRAYDHPLYNLLHLSPNAEMTAYTFIETVLTHLLLWGNSYTQIIRDGRGQVTALYPLMPNKMTVDRNSDGEIVCTYTADKGQIKLSRYEILHIPQRASVAGLGFDGVVGYSPVAMAKQAVGMSIACEEYGAAFLRSGANLADTGPVREG